MPSPPFSYFAMSSLPSHWFSSYTNPKKFPTPTSNTKPTLNLSKIIQQKNRFLYFSSFLENAIIKLFIHQKGLMISLLRSSSAAELLHKNERTDVRVVKQLKGKEFVDLYYVGKYLYRESDLLGSGFSSKVYKATMITNSKEKFAIKVIDIEKFGNVELLDMEIQTLMSINHPNVIRCLDVIKTPKIYYLITEYCPHGDLDDLIKLQKYIPEDRAILIMKQIVDGYKALMAKRIIHRDLKPANIMRFGNSWKIGDFGFARFCKEEFLLQKIQVGTPLYLPLECHTTNKYSCKSDIFSLGVILYEMLLGSTPWPAKTEEQLIQMMKKCSSPSIPEGIQSPQARTFLQKTLQIDYYDRMSNSQFKKFSFQNADINKLIRSRSPRGMSPALKLKRSGSKSPRRIMGIKSASKGSTCTSISSQLKQSDSRTASLKQSPISAFSEYFALSTRPSQKDKSGRKI